ncbi:alpha/beta fold hydrolase [Paenibacillus validus]|uniref:alpha/beta fold hydrolase n=1 Tax=Paenibacillus validus TaxID=44253 RepID=UPI003D2B1FB7
MSSPELLTIQLRKGAQAKVLVAGEGKPVIFLHGAGGLKWDVYLEELAKEYKVYAPYFPGTGGATSCNELDLRNLWDVVLYYFDLIDLLGIENVDIIGHSFGGMLAAELAATDSRRVQNLLLLCAAGLWDEEIEKRSASMEGDLNSKLFYDNESPLAQAHFALPEDADKRLEVLIDQQVVMAEASRFLWPLPDKGLRRRLHRIRAQTCIVWGKQDAILPVDYAYVFQKGILGATVEVLDQTSHFPQLEQLDDVLETTFSLLTPDPVAKQ